MNVKIEIHNRCLDTRRENVKDWNIPDSVKKDIDKFLDELALGKVNKGKKVGESRLVKYLDLLKMPLEYFNKPLSKVTMKDVESFEKDLSSDMIKSRIKKRGYSQSTKVDIRKALKIFLRWKLGVDKANKLIDWLDTRNPVKTPDFLKEIEIEKLFKSCRNTEQRFLIAVLFDSGARAEEFHNIRYEDITLPEKEENYVKIALKEEYSKTKGRTISLFWKYSREAVEDYIRERIQEGMKSSDPVFKMGYDTARVFLHRLGKSVLKKSIHYHLFRHSSATYYADKMNRQQLCMRYGWAFTSNMPDVYISRAGLNERELEEKFSGGAIKEAKEDLEKERRKIELIKQDLEKQIKEMKEDFGKILKAQKIKE